MIEAKSTIAASLVVATFAAFVPSAVLAQARPDPQGDGSLPGYDATTETTLSGTVESMSDGRSRWRWLSGMHLLPGRGQPPQTNLLLKTDTGLARIHLGPTAFLGERNIEIRTGDTVQVTGLSVCDRRLAYGACSRSAQRRRGVDISERRRATALGSGALEAAQMDREKNRDDGHRHGGDGDIAPSLAAEAPMHEGKRPQDSALAVPRQLHRLRDLVQNVDPDAFAHELGLDPQRTRQWFQQGFTEDGYGAEVIAALGRLLLAKIVTASSR